MRLEHLGVFLVDSISYEATEFCKALNHRQLYKISYIVVVYALNFGDFLVVEQLRRLKILFVLYDEYVCIGPTCIANFRMYGASLRPSRNRQKMRCALMQELEQVNCSVE